MFPSKKIRTKIRKLLGLIPEGQEVADPVGENSKDRFDFLFKNRSFLKAYIEPDRLAFFDEIVDLCTSCNLFDQVNRIADIGCGTGHLLKAIHQKHPTIELLGTDFSESALEVTKNTIPLVRTEKLDIYECNESYRKQFDIVFCTEVIEHLLYPKRAIDNLLQYINEKGVLFLSVPDGRKDTYRGHINFWSPESWKCYIEDTVDLSEYEVGFFIIESGMTNVAIIKKRRHSI